MTQRRKWLFAAKLGKLSLLRCAKDNFGKQEAN